MQVRKIGLLDINDSMEFLKLKEGVDSLMAKIVKSGGEQNLYNLAKSRPFSVTIYRSEICKLLTDIESAIARYGSKDMYVSKELSNIKAKLSNLRDNIKKCL